MRGLLRLRMSLIVFFTFSVHLGNEHVSTVNAHACSENNNEQA